MSKKKQRNQKKKKEQIRNYDVLRVRMRRFFAMIIDWYLAQMIAVIPITFYFRGDDYLKASMFQLENYDFEIGLFLGVFGIIVGIIYYVLVPILLWKGQTIGKKICKIKIVQVDGSPVKPLSIIVRELIGSTFLEGGIIIIATYIRRMLPLFGLTVLVDPLKYIAYGLTIASIVYAYFQPLSQAFHDKIAKTVVVNEK